MSYLLTHVINKSLDISAQFDNILYMKSCKSCGGIVEQERAELGLPNCLGCAKRIGAERYKGRMVYEHKTGGYIEVMPKESYEHNKKFFNRTGNRSVLKQV